MDISIEEYMAWDNDPQQKEYFRQLEVISTSIKKKDYWEAKSACEASYPLIPRVIECWRAMEGKCDIATYPCLDVGMRFWVALGEKDKINEALECIRPVRNKYLTDYKRELKEASKNAKDALKIQTFIIENPAVLQKDVPKLMNESGYWTGPIINDLAKLGLITRVPFKKTYRLYLPYPPSGG